MTRLSSLWGKARRADSGGVSHHPLLWHLLDVAAVGCAVLDRDEPLRAALSRTFDLDAQALRRWVGFFLALHDIGKASRLFQATVPELWPEVFAEPPPRPLSAPPHHTELGLDLLLERIGEELDPVLKQWRDDLRELLLTPVLAHHGRPRRAPDTLVQVEAWGSRGLAIGRFLVRLLLGLFDPPAPSPPGRRELARASWRLAGLVTLADWIASAQRWFPYEDPDHDPKAYLETIARPRAERALAEAGTGRASPAPALGTEALVGPDARPTPLQRAVAEIPLPEGPALFLIEEQTGAGKTEAALLLAHRLMAERAARGLYLALPTMATANAMFARMGASGRRLFAEKEPPSLALAHSRAALHEGFVAVPVPFDEPDEKGRDGDEAGREARAWLADDRRKTFLADLGVGTLDQALLAVLPASFQALRLLGLAERVLVVDEAHAYDAYTTGLLGRLLRFQAALGGSAIVLSATLPLSIRGELVGAFLRGLEHKGGSVACRAYPLLTIASAGGIAERPVAPRAELARRIAVQRLPNEEEALAAVGEAAAAGAAVLWIRNTVDEAIASQARLAENGIKAELFHARFATGDRLVREQEVLRRFGKHAAPEARRGVLVATQVVEQSLDLDFDLIVTDLAPIDCLVQRAGRLWRHPGRDRPLPAPRFLVLAPDPVDAPARDWIAGFLPGTAAVYRDHLRLWRSARALFARSALEIPGDVRALVEEVYAENGEVPEGLERNWYASDGERKAAQALARQNALDPDRGYLAEGAWDSDVRTPTRLGEPMITLRLARFEGGRIEP
ncbi:MAG: CRISPR-associated helicase Cas3', partial [Geminicoccaceae bacterium]|nr:CRISPR-associated helicase Cas3' [Geminicoccaceae bacterium]